MTRLLGIDEAGYGPTLGPLVIAAAAADAADHAALVAGFTGTGIDDSKRVHDTHDLAPLECLALAGITWLTGFQPDTAADCFALLGETPAARANVPWMANAAALNLPLAAPSIPRWRLDGVTPRGLSGAILQPVTINAAHQAGRNKADQEWGTVAALIAAAHQPERAMAVTVDRLGGRKFYQPGLQTVFPQTLVLVEEETPEASRYRIPGEGHDGTAIAFLVGGESASPLTALASCIAKYVRELHMVMLNRHWSGRLPWLKPTAGYPQDAKRWLYQLGEGQVGAWKDHLVRNV